MYYFIVNPRSGNGKGLLVWKYTKRYLIKKNREYEVYFTSGSNDARNKARELTSDCPEPLFLVTIGGDGTINEVVDGAVLGDNVVFGFIPAGYGGDFGRGLGLPANIKRSVRRVLSGSKIDKIDYGVLSCGDRDNGCIRRFILRSGMGFDAALCHSVLREKQDDGRRLAIPMSGGIAYICMGIREFMAAKPIKGYIILDGDRRVEFNNILFISAHICPKEYGDRARARSETVSDGTLSVCVVSTESKLRLVKTLLRSRGQAVKRSRGIKSFKCKELRIHTESPLAVHTDGENCKYHTDVNIRCVERQLRLIR